MIFFPNYRDSLNKSYSYEAISCIEFQGKMKNMGESRGHYICDVKSQPHGIWFRTNDNQEPEEIDKSVVSKSPYVILFKRK